MKPNRLYVLILLLLSFFSYSSAELNRRASWEASLVSNPEGPGRVIKSLETDSPLAKAGFKVGDLIISVNGQVITTPEVYYDISDALVAGKTYTVLAKSKNKTIKTTVQFNPLGIETYANHDVLYEEITSDYGLRQRTIITKPKSQSKPLPAVFIIQGLSCSSIEQTPGRKSAFTRLLTDIIKQTELVIMRIEKPGLGDSEGNCSKTDFKTELNGYETALKELLSKDYVKSDQVIVYGNSMGSALAPYMANKFNLAGVISDGTYMKTWFEHMLEIERRILAMKGNTQAQISQKMRHAYIPLYHGMLNLKQSYQQVIEQYPAIEADNYHGPNHMYGRPMAFYHQLNEFDIPGAWEQIKVPVRIRWGTNDWIMSESDNDMIIDILKANGHKDHQLLKVDGLDHWQAIHPDAKSSFNGQTGQWDNQISGVIVGWIKELIQ